MTPKYEIIYQTIASQIKSGALAMNERLPDEDALAAEYGVSLITVRRALTDLANAGLIRRVRGRGSFVNQTLEKSGEKVIALMLNHGNTAAVSVSRIVSGVHDMLAAHGYRLLMQWDVNDSVLTRESVGRMLTNQPQGILVYPYDPVADADSYAYIRSRGLPFVLLDRRDYAHPHDYVAADHFMGGMLAAREFTRLGHRKTACIVNLFFLNSEQERYAGFKNGLRDSHEPMLLNLSEGERLSRIIRDNGITGLFCVSDRIAAETIKLLGKAGLRVPEDVSIIGFDDCLYNSDISFPIASIRVDFNAIGRSAAERLLTLIENPDTEKNLQTFLNVELIARETSLRDLTKENGKPLD